MPTKCTKSDNDKSEADATALGRKYFTGIKVTILTADANTGDITFSAGGSEKAHTATWGEEKQMWIRCPCTFPADPKADGTIPVPAEKTVGELYLDSEFVQAESDAGKPINLATGDPKWPKAFVGAPAVKRMLIAPTSIVVSGFEMMDPGPPHAFSGLDLMDPKVGSGYPQGVAFDPDTKLMAIWLTEDAWSDVGVDWNAFKELASAHATIRKDKHVDPAKLSRAWRTVSQCAQAYAEPNTRKQVTEEQRGMLAELLGRDLG